MWTESISTLVALTIGLVFAPRARQCLLVSCLLIGLNGGIAMAQDPAAKITRIDLNPWTVSLDDGNSFTPIQVPGTIEDQIQLDFDGVSIYQTQLPSVNLENGQRAILRFDAVATHAKVFVSDKPFDKALDKAVRPGELIGEHLGGWTPFSVDVTRYVNDDQKQWLIVQVDEKVGHNTQGFLPIVTHHFGGIWKPVTIEVYNEAMILRDKVAILPSVEANTIAIEIPVNAMGRDVPNIKVSVAEIMTENQVGQWIPLAMEWASEQKDLTLKAQDTQQPLEWVLSGTSVIPFQWKLWNTDSPYPPQRYAIKFELVAFDGTVDDSWQTRFGVRQFETRGDQFLLNGHPCSIRGLLNWGYAPPSVAPSLDESWMRSEIEFAKERGFNLMKFCLWVPPKRYLELCDEMGMLAWVEYPTWHPKLDQHHLAELRQEYKEFFEYDRNYACVVLRSLTCETGPSADIEVIRSLYDLCKSMIPGAVVEDDSSWISWNRIHDFYDDHPYGNNHTWVDTLTRLKNYIGERELKPLALGEAIAADSWTIPADGVIEYAESNAAHGVWSAGDARRWINTLSDLAASRGRSFDPELLRPQSLQYGMLMRKFQIETFHREVPHGAYVVSVIRDFPKAAMGLIDFQNQAKSTANDWQFHGPAIILLETENDRRSFPSGARGTFKLICKNLSQGYHPSESISCQLIDSSGKVVLDERSALNQRDGRIVSALEVSMPTVTSPERIILKTTWGDGEDVHADNSWPIWVFPTLKQMPQVAIHPSAEELASALPVQATEQLDDNTILLTRKLDREILKRLEEGGKVLLIPDGSKDSFPIQNHWFLRGSVLALPRESDKWHVPFLAAPLSFENNMLVELQHFDLAGPAVPNIDHFMDLVDPMVLLWDNHDLREVRTHGLAFRMEVGQGTLLVTTLNFTGPTNAAGQWLLAQWIEQLQNESKHSMDEATRLRVLHRLRDELQAQQVELHQDEWQFQPDPKQLGLHQNWHAIELDDSKWHSIRVDRHWEGQGFAELNGWAWYRRNVRVDTNWNAESTYLNFTGIDDYADIYINGEKMASVGNIERKETAFETRMSIDISKHVEPGKPLLIAVAVYDWFGAGGIFRPVTITSTPLSDNPPILK